MNVSGPNIPFHAARAYGIQRPATVAPVKQAPTPESTSPAATIGSTDVAQTTPGVASRLVAGVVPGSIDFSGSEPTPKNDALPFYRHPADRNAAAVAIQLGRSLDVSG